MAVGYCNITKTYALVEICESEEGDWVVWKCTGFAEDLGVLGYQNIELTLFQIDC